MLYQLFLVFIGSGIGGSIRFFISTFLKETKSSCFPYQTLVVNFLSSFLLGIFIVFISKRTNIESSLRAILVVGICGGFSTFSTFSYDNLLLCQNGQYVHLFLNIFSSVFLCILAVYLGYQLAN